MNTSVILYPMIALAWWTMTVLMLVPYRRLNPSLNGGTEMDDYSIGESARVQPYVSTANRNYMNLLELPVLFYVTCTLLFIANAVSEWAIYLAWAFVALRIIHSIIHVTYNNVMHRFMVFGLSNFALLGLMVIMTRAIVAI